MRVAEGLPAGVGIDWSVHGMLRREPRWSLCPGERQIRAAVTIGAADEVRALVR